MPKKLSNVGPREQIDRTFAANLMDMLPICVVVCMTRHRDPKTFIDYYVTGSLVLSAKLRVGLFDA